MGGGEQKIDVLFPFGFSLAQNWLKPLQAPAPEVAGIILRLDALMLLGFQGKTDSLQSLEPRKQADISNLVLRFDRAGLLSLQNMRVRYMCETYCTRV